MFRRENTQPELNWLLCYRTCQSLDGTLGGRISWWVLGRQAFQAYLTINLNTPGDPNVLWNTVCKPLLEFKAKGTNLQWLLGDTGSHQFPGSVGAVGLQMPNNFKCGPSLLTWAPQAAGVTVGRAGDQGGLPVLGLSI